jgi:hypothetical protein
MTDVPAGKPGPAAPTISVKINDETHRGVYSNKVIIAHNADEFILDFVVDFPPGPQIVARVVTAPGHVLALLEALGENISRYEKQHGRIRKPGAPPRANA